MTKTAIQFLRSQSPYKADQIAVFDTAHAEKLIKLGIAKVYIAPAAPVTTAGPGTVVVNNEPARVLVKGQKINKAI